jgi:hypothetical protein
VAGGPSHLETLDHKPDLARMHGKPMPESFTRGMPIARPQGQKLVCFAPQHSFQRCGASGRRTPVVSAADPAELAAWTSAARVILNLHETIRRRSVLVRPVHPAGATIDISCDDQSIPPHHSLGTRR